MRRSIGWTSAIVVGIVAVALGVARAQPPELRDAIDTQIELASENPSDPGVLSDLGNLQVLAGDLDGAETSYRRAISVAPSHAAGHYNLGLLLQQDGRLEEALEHYRRVVEIEPEHAWGRYQLGTVLDALGDGRAATHEYARAFQVEPNLTFPEINPHVIENRLMVPALLQAYGGRPQERLAPMSFEQAGRIASIMVPSETATQGDQLAFDDDQTPAELEGLGAKSLPAGGAHGTFPTTRRSDPLTQQERTGTGPPSLEALESAAAERRTQTDPAAGAAAGEGIGGSGATVVGGGSAASSAGGTAPDGGGTTAAPSSDTPEGDRFVPDPASTARLELRLRPTPSPAP